MNSSEQILSNEWVTVDHLWDDFAEGWFRQDGNRSTFMFHIPAHQFENADSGDNPTIQRLLDSASILKDEVKSWQIGDASSSPMEGNDLDFDQPLPSPASDATYLAIYVHLKPQTKSDTQSESFGQEMSLEKWQILDACWRAILVQEASIDTLRLSMDGLRSEMESAIKRSISVEEKVHALQSDVAQWNKAKSRIIYSLPKVREFVHRATWATAGPERKNVEELVKNYIEPRILHPEMDRVRERLEHLQKDRQVLFSQGNAVNHECRGLLGELQRAISTLQRNAADRARQKRSAGRDKGKHL